MNLNGSVLWILFTTNIEIIKYNAQEDWPILI